MQYLANIHRPGFSPMLGAIQNPLDVANLPVLNVDTYSVFDAPDISIRFNLLSYIAYFDGQFIATWAQGANENVSGQHVIYSTSPDGLTWSAPQDVTPAAPSGWMYGAAGLWERDGDLWAIYRYSEVGDGSEGDHYYGPSLALYGKPWSGSGWGSEALICDNCTLDQQPILLRTGKWYATGRDRDFNTIMILGDTGDWTRITVPSPAGVLLNEATILPIGGGGVISYEYRNLEDMSTRVLLRSFSFDDGETISPPAPTNFPDAGSRRAVMRLSDGRYVLCSNASDEWGRKKLMLSVSDDGLSYDRVYILRGEPTSPKWGGSGLPREGYQYPQMIEKDGDLWVIYSRNKEDIQVSKVSLDAFT